MADLSKIQPNALDLTAEPLIASTGTFSSNIAVSGNITANGTLGVTGAITNTAGSFNSYTLNHSTTNGSAGAGSPTSTKIVRTGERQYQYSFYFYASTGGYPTCPNSYWAVCPIQKNLPASLAFATVEVFGVHRGMYGTSYSEYYQYKLGAGSDGGGYYQFWSYNQGNCRPMIMQHTGVVDESAAQANGWGTAGNTIAIGNGYYKMPFFLKIYTSCGADKEWEIKVTTSDPISFGPPFKGPMWLTPNTVPTSAVYW